jgi:hypothetical protein
MNLDEKQRQAVSAWVDQGMKLFEIQKKLESEFGLRLTYLEARMLVDDLHLSLKNPQPLPPPPVVPPALAKETPPQTPPPDAGPGQPAAGNVSVTVDQLARPGALVSGKVKFSDGKTAEWFLDQSGRLGLAPTEKGYKPPAGDLQSFQMALQTELEKLGM